MDQKKLDEHSADPNGAPEYCSFPKYDPTGKVCGYTSAICEVVERWGCLGSLRPSILSDLHVLNIQDTMDIRAIRYDCIILFLYTSLPVKAVQLPK